MIEDRLNGTPVVIQLPIGKEADFHGVVDLVTMVAHYWPSDGMGEEWEDRAIPDDMKADADKYRHDLIEALADHDEEVMELYIAEQEPDVDADPQGPPPGTDRRRDHTRSCAAPRSRTRPCSRCSTRSAGTCRARWTCLRTRAITPRRGEVGRCASPTTTSRSRPSRSRS